MTNSEYPNEDARKALETLGKFRQTLAGAADDAALRDVTPIKRRQPAKPKTTKQVQVTESKNVQCPKCKSEQITGDKQGFGVKKAVAGAVLTGGVGLVAGAINMNKVKVNCLACGHSWDPAELANVEAWDNLAENIDKNHPMLANILFFGGLALMGYAVYWVIS